MQTSGSSASRSAVVMDDLVLVGRVARAHGNRGHVIVNPDTDFPDERFRPGRSAPGGAAAARRGGFVPAIPTGAADRRARRDRDDGRRRGAGGGGIEGAAGAGRVAAGGHLLSLRPHRMRGGRHGRQADRHGHARGRDDGNEPAGGRRQPWGSADSAGRGHLHGDRRRAAADRGRTRRRVCSR